MAYSGRFRAQNPSKYKGDAQKIFYRSSWERKLMLYLDKHPAVQWWSSEEVVIPYVSPVDMKFHRYFPDFLMCTLKDGKEHVTMIEVKPEKQTRAPKKPKKLSNRYVVEVMQWGVNDAKWNAARAYCEERGWSFVIMSETELGVL